MRIRTARPKWSSVLLRTIITVGRRSVTNRPLPLLPTEPSPFTMPQLLPHAIGMSSIGKLEHRASFSYGLIQPLLIHLTTSLLTPINLIHLSGRISAWYNRDET